MPQLITIGETMAAFTPDSVGLPCAMCRTSASAPPVPRAM